jgi:predicted MFS family arabinose efflux permease
MLVLPLSGWSLTFAAAGLALLTTVAGLLCKCVSNNHERQDERHRSSAASTRQHRVLSLLLLQGLFSAGYTSVRG